VAVRISYPVPHGAEVGVAGEEWHADRPRLLGSVATSRSPEAKPDTVGSVGGGLGNRTWLPASAPAVRKAVPAGWPAKQADPVWAWLGRPRSPLAVIVAGAEGGVGTSTVTALVGETIAAGSPGPTLVVDQCGSLWGSLPRRLLGQRGGLSGEQARSMLQHGIGSRRVLGAAPRTSAGAAVFADGAMYTPVWDFAGLARTPYGSLVVDGGLVNLMLTARLDLDPVVVVVGRADDLGAEAVCAALGFLSGVTTQPGARPPVVVLASPAPVDRRRVQAAHKLVVTTGVAQVVHVPYDARLATATALRLDQVGRATATACLRMVAAIGTTQEVLGDARDTG
jgi:hypothetical protein